MSMQVTAVVKSSTTFLPLEARACVRGLELGMIRTLATIAAALTVFTLILTASQAMVRSDEPGAGNVPVEVSVPLRD